MGDVPAHLLLGSPRHGVRLLASQLAGELGAALMTGWDDMHVHTGVHLHLTGSLLEQSTPHPVAALGRLAKRTRLTVTLHDVPQLTDGSSFARRRQMYRAVLRVADGWAVSSRHEAALVHQYLAPRTPGLVAPLPVIARQHGRPPEISSPEPATVAVFGFLYPGKGHRELLEAAGRLRSRTPVTVLALGDVAPGNSALVAELRALARRLEVGFEVTGHLADDAVPGWVRRVDVGVCGHRNVSASGSTNTWIAAGRRPLVREGRYAREMAALRPGCLRLYTDDTLADAVREAIEQPASTWLGDDVDTAPHLADTAAAYRGWWHAC